MGEGGALRAHQLERLWTLIHDEAEPSLFGHAVGFEVAADDRAAVVLHGFGDVEGGDVHEGLPGDARRAAGVEEVEGLALELPLRARCFIERKGAHAIDHVLEVCRNREVPDGGGDDDAVSVQNLLLERTEVVIGVARFLVVCEGEVFDREVSEPHFLCCRTLDGSDPLDECIGEGTAVAWLIDACDDDEDAHGVMIAQ